MKVYEAITVLGNAIATLSNLDSEAEVNVTVDLDINPVKPLNGFSRLRWDRQVSETSPVVDGTWVTVAAIISMISDDYTWGKILQYYPELTDDDIRQAVVYHLKQNGGVRG